MEYWTKEQKAIYQKEWRKNHVIKIRAYQIEYRKKFPNYQKAYKIKNPDYFKNWRKKNPNYLNDFRKKNPSYFNDYFREKRKTDVQFRIGQNLRLRLRDALKGKSGKGCITYLGCTLSELKMYLEGQFKDGMSWDNYGLKTWHIDHKTPLAFYNLTDEVQLRLACHYSNLQPMWAKENISKGKKLIYE